MSSLLCRIRQKGVHPQNIPNCGHTLCLKCLIQIHIAEETPKCPLDRKFITESFQRVREPPTNVAMVQLITGNLSTKYGICAFHQEPMSLYCVTDNVMACESCVEGNDDAKHKGHKIQTLSEVQNLVQIKSDKIKSIIKKVDTEQSAILGLLDEKKNEIQGLKKRKFDHIRSLIDKKEEETWSEIELLFARKKTKTEEVFKKDEQLKQKWQIDLATLNNKKLDHKFFDTLNNDAYCKKFESFCSRVRRYRS